MRTYSCALLMNDCPPPPHTHLSPPPPGQVWNTITGDELLTLEGHRNVVYAIAFNNPYGDKIITGSFGACSSSLLLLLLFVCLVCVWDHKYVDLCVCPTCVYKCGSVYVC